MTVVVGAAAIGNMGVYFAATKEYPNPRPTIAATAMDTTAKDVPMAYAFDKLKLFQDTSWILDVNNRLVFEPLEVRYSKRA